MTRPFRPSYIGPSYAWLGWFALAAGFVALLALLSWCGDMARADCERKGGEYVVLYKSAICVKKGSVIR